MSERGRPTKATPEEQAAIVKLARTTTLGRDAIAEACGIHRTSLRAWLQRGEAGDPEFAPFLAAFKTARAQMEAETLGKAIEVATGKASKTKIIQVMTPRLTRDGKPIWETDASGKRVQVMDEVKDRTIITEKIPADPMAVVMLLERLDPARYGRAGRIEALERATQEAREESQQTHEQDQAGSLVDVAESLSALSVDEQRELVARLQRNIEGAETLELDEVE